MKYQIGLNIDKHGCSRCIKAGYYKMGLGNLLYHPNDGFTAPCVMEYELEEISSTNTNKKILKNEQNINS